MDLVSAIDVNLACTEWSRACPGAASLARETAERTLLHGGAAARLAGREPVELGITLAGTAEQQRLNREYRGRDAPTNVLAFQAWEPGTHLPPGAPLLLGDIVLAFETVRQEAVEQQKPLADHLRHLVVHGVLHLLGFDHRDDAEAAAMESLETSILAQLAVPDPYRDRVGAAINAGRE